MAAEVLATAVAKATTQIEFYFCDSNLPRDKFLLAKSNADEDKAGDGMGYVPLELLCTFKRMRDYKGELADAEFVGGISTALAASTALEVSEDGKSIRRKTALPSADTSMKRSIYAKGFPVETGLDEIIAFFNGLGLGATKAVRMRYLPSMKQGTDAVKTKAFKGSVFVEWATVAEAEKALATAIEFKGTALLVKGKEAYIAEKRAALPPREQAESKKRKHAGGGEEQGGAAKVSAPPKEIVKGACLRFEGVGEGVSREDVKEVFGKYDATINWVLFDRGSTEGSVLFNEAGAATAVLEKAFEAGMSKLGDKEPTLTALEEGGEEEKAAWQAVWDFQASLKERQQGRKEKKSRR